MRRSSRVVVVALVLSLAGCTGLPTAGTVQAGGSITAADDAPSFDFRPDSPQLGASPQQIVDGFITAASSPEGTSASGSWAIARSFLAPDYRASWNPQAGVVVDVFADRQYTVADDGTVTVQVTPIATVDAAGTYTPAEGGTTALTYRLAQQADEQWRIVSAPAGLLMDEDLFPRVFRSYSLMYFDPTWTYLVPDVRWFPALNAAGRIATALVNGDPAQWLAASVTSAFPDGVDLTPAVPIVGGVAEAELSAQALAVDGLTLDRMQTQLEASLATAGVARVEMLVDGTVLGAQRLATASTKVDSRALVLGAAGFGFLVSGELTPLEPLSPVLAPLEPTAIELGRDHSVAAVQLPDGEAARVTAEGAVVVDDRAGLIAPTIDPFGGIWTAPFGAPGELRVTDAAGGTVRLAGAWTGATRISSMQVSRDGSRIAAVLSYGGAWVVAVAGIVRDGRGVPTAVGDPQILTRLTERGVDVGWLDDTSVGAIGGTATGTFVAAPIGGAASTLALPGVAVSLAGARDADSVRVLDADGVLYDRRSSAWVQAASGVAVLAAQQGPG